MATRLESYIDILNEFLDKSPSQPYQYQKSPVWVNHNPKKGRKQLMLDTTTKTINQRLGNKNTESAKDLPSIRQP